MTPADHDYHIPVLLAPVRDTLAPRPGGHYIDMTLGGGGHSAMMLQESAPNGRLLGLDRDPSALTQAGHRLAEFGDRATLTHSTFDRVAEVAAEHGFDGADGILMDIGVSSRQLDSAERGFSFRESGLLDMRMDPSADIATAADLVATLEQAELARIFFEYGEERYARRVARAIVQDRETTPFTTTTQLAGLVARVIPQRGAPSRIHPATRVFQALRIAVNDELGMLDRGLDAAFSVLGTEGRLAVISFHSLEDRMVKRRFAAWATGCICPKEFPLCRCGQTPRAQLITRKPISGTPQEVVENRRARSAHLRVVSKLSHADAAQTASGA